MDTNDAMLRILSQPVACPACGSDNPPHALQCEACQAVLRVEEEERKVSILSVSETSVPKFADGSPKVKTPVEEGKNYIAMKDAALRARNKQISLEEYTATIQRLRTICGAGLQVFASEMMTRKFAQEPEDAQAAKQAMHEAFKLLYEGLTQMERYTQSHDMNDVVQGEAVAEQGFYAISSAQDLALALDA